MRYGLDGHEAHTFSAIAEHMGRTRQAAESVTRRAVARLARLATATQGDNV